MLLFIVVVVVVAGYGSCTPCCTSRERRMEWLKEERERKRAGRIKIEYPRNGNIIFVQIPTLSLFVVRVCDVVTFLVSDSF